MDIIFLQEFRTRALIGVYPWERSHSQIIQLDLEIAMPSNRACQTDDLVDALDYAVVVQRIETMLAEERFSLLEALAGRVARLILEEFGSPWVKVSVAKLGALRGVKRLGVCIERRSGA
ncbi:dihydroneopterin aldolase [Nitrosovibrio sp. Nv17]|jgi:dihydroneopterin aldolase|uniref:dihydroneopterin aldolase n=1 Tax=Nitrosovibrio sp. Nv17 TaxID=1855339 RepID=UPI00090853F6|nr:dihydroneopterin aldolase [Nitrosovibrio sp. Nv17]SFW28658.1 dihydroneopterin aldolase [Nitrosovibrio sp. Nv17]